ncbi:hypothetical protein HOLleu_37626 [Holothuria leucospilota]|uniref:Uncharacterized protein n=1 Tax=Holothuria leucospilota TaxID=206669 RepID=A0A9Q0YM52_HOLLE|nr:hypothetical protein HOLleu_37626 [Holothuria leucospilota]
MVVFCSHLHSQTVKQPLNLASTKIILLTSFRNTTFCQLQDTKMFSSRVLFLLVLFGAVAIIASAPSRFENDEIDDLVARVAALDPDVRSFWKHLATHAHHYLSNYLGHEEHAT